MGDATVFDDQFTFNANPEYEYVIDGWMKGEDIHQQTTCYWMVEWYSLTEGEPVIHENREYLVNNMAEFIEAAELANVPLNIGEFGVNWYGWMEDRGGDRWFSDMFSIAEEYGMNFQIWAYHDIFGMYTANNVYPSEHSSEHINTFMIDTLTNLFASLE